MSRNRIRPTKFRRKTITLVVLLLLVFPLIFPNFCRTFPVSALPVHLLLCVFHLYFLTLRIPAVAGFQSAFWGAESCHLSLAVSALGGQARLVTKFPLLSIGEDRVLRPWFFLWEERHFKPPRGVCYSPLMRKGQPVKTYKRPALDVLGSFHWISSSCSYRIFCARAFLSLTSPIVNHPCIQIPKQIFLNVSVPWGRIVALLSPPNNDNNNIFYL